MCPYPIRGYRFGWIRVLSCRIKRGLGASDYEIPLHFKTKTEPWISDPTVREKRERWPHRLGFRASPAMRPAARE
jgi:hypothetical protein